ncbi:hypothetical protein HMJ29_08570 [Hymenobacter taeanensis]|uniref:Uncharacterized protein n=1 Tax=Hymenobacter taeanensis TaxID=2735321 RepID=A0A6M6BI55_9BACT|nr:MULTISPECIES: hypothetical protein [Hymenobacter]QJX46983.1 hypothetical protein HMJ29_08570 [Hymenobacter taeanensis]UOQ80860.1 hypothetical protein MUN83_18935 [Hymenobacter sp. 5414T-23]
MTYSLPTPLLPFLLVLMLCVLLAFGLSVAAWRRVNHSRRGWRVGAGLLASAGLWLLAFPPSQPLRSTTTEALLLTDGYSPDTLRQLLRQLGPGTHFWRYASLAASPDTPTLSNLAALRQRLPGLRRLHVLGQGLPAADLPELNTVGLVRHSGAAHTGFRMASWARSTQVGQPWVVEGYLNNHNSAAPVWVRLRAAGGLRDSVKLPNGWGAFRLQFTPKAEGRAVYQLDARAATANGLRLAPEPLPLEVVPARPLRLLLLAATPSFEFRFLKDHLARQGHAVALRVGVSRGLTQTEFLNQSAAAIGQLTPALLHKTDVLVADAASLTALSGTEAGALQAALRNGQSGLILLTDPAVALPRALPARSDFVLQLQAARAAQEPQAVYWAAAGSAKALVPATLRPAPALRVLVTTQGRQPIAAARRIGLGQVVVTTVTETFPWVLQGQTTSYASYWSQLLTAATPPNAPAATIRPENSWPRLNAPLTIRATALAPGPITVKATAGKAVRVALQQDEQMPDWVRGTFWPGTSGWHQASGPQTSSWFYVFSSQQWRGLEAQLRQQAATQWIAQHQPATLPAVAATTGSEPWSRWWGFGLFVLGSGLLWLEEKL